MSDHWDEDELILYADNDEPLYRQKDTFLANVHRRLKKGTLIQNGEYDRYPPTRRDRLRSSGRRRR